MGDVSQCTCPSSTVVFCRTICPLHALPLPVEMSEWLSRPLFYHAGIRARILKGMFEMYLSKWMGMSRYSLWCPRWFLDFPSWSSAPWYVLKSPDLEGHALFRARTIHQIVKQPIWKNKVRKQKTNFIYSLY